MRQGHQKGITDYGVWKARPVTHVVEHDPKQPHLQLYFDDGHSHERTSNFESHIREGGYQKAHHGRDGPDPKGIAGLYRAAINIKSGDEDESRLVFWIERNFRVNPMVNEIADLEMGFHSLQNGEKRPGGKRLDFIRSNLFNVNSGRILYHDIPGPNNDMIDVLDPLVNQAIEKQAEIYIYGDRFRDNGEPDGIHEVHMNQGNIPQHIDEDGTFQDGGLIINYPDSGEWVGVFTGFASQAVHTNNITGHAIEGSETWADYLSPESNRSNLLENSVSIDEASVNAQPRRRSVTLSNHKGRDINVGGWKIKNSAGQSQGLPSNAVIGSNGTSTFDISNVDLSNIADTVTLLNEKGLKVDGVSYNSHPGNVDGQSVVFAP